MAHWAQIDENNKVIQVVVGNNEDVDEGYQWLIENFGGHWIKTSYNSCGGIHYLPELDENFNKVPSGQPHLRYNYAGIGYFYNEEKDAFIPPKPDIFIDQDGNSFDWVLDESTCLWTMIPL